MIHRNPSMHCFHPALSLILHQQTVSLFPLFPSCVFIFTFFLFPQLLSSLFFTVFIVFSILCLIYFCIFLLIPFLSVLSFLCLSFWCILFLYPQFFSFHFLLPLFCPNFSFYLFLFMYCVSAVPPLFTFLFHPSVLLPQIIPFLFSLPTPPPPLPWLPLPFPVLLSSLPSFLPCLTVHDVLPLELIHLCLFCSAFSPLLTLLLRHPSIPPSPLCADWDSGRPAVTRQQARCSLASSQALLLPPAQG